MMPKIDGVEVCRRLKSDNGLPFIPIVLVTAKVDSKDVVAGLEAGADEYLTKPVDPAALVARVKSMLRIKELTDQVASWNRTLEDRVAQQLKQIERMDRLRRFLSPQVAELIFCRQETIAFSIVTAATSLWCFAICAALPLSPKRRSRKKL